MYLVVAIWGFVIGDGESILGLIPVNTEDNFLHLRSLGDRRARAPARHADDGEAPRAERRRRAAARAASR